ncbi:hypothetical protein MTP99_003800 [Tenebrio molitor]|nr:hypothetical protein MTP99_003800 [Tenebrio molitor]
MQRLRDVFRVYRWWSVIVAGVRPKREHNRFVVRHCEAFENFPVRDVRCSGLSGQSQIDVALPSGVLQRRWEDTLVENVQVIESDKFLEHWRPSIVLLVESQGRPSVKVSTDNEFSTCSRLDDPLFAW